MKSHEYARALIEVGQFLQQQPEFETEYDPHLYLGWYYDKEKFLTAVRALGSGNKEYSGDDLVFEVQHGESSLRLSIPRDKVCRKVQDAIWECEPLLTPEEEQELGN